MSGVEGSRERRRQIREKKRLQVRFGPGDLAHAGYTLDISESGVSLQAGVTYPPNSILVVQIDFPDETVAFRGIVRWARELPPAFKRNLKGSMGLAFLQGAQTGRSTPPVETREPPPLVKRRGVPPDVSDLELKRAPTRRRQISTISGNTFEVLESDYRGAVYVRIAQLPLTDGSHGTDFQEAFWTREEAEAAVKAFLKTR